MKEVYYCTQRRLSGNSAAILFCTQASVRRELSGRAGRGAGVRGRRKDGRSVPLHLGLSSKWAYSTKTRAHQIWWAPDRDTKWHQQGPGDSNWGLEMMRSWRKNLPSAEQQRHKLAIHLTHVFNTEYVFTDQVFFRSYISCVLRYIRLRPFLINQ